MKINRNTFRDKVYGCYLGKNIGGTLGGPYEGKKYVMDLDFYTPVPAEPMANDDLDLQLVMLAMLEEKGPNFTLSDLAEIWMRYCPAYPWNEYGFFVRNYDRGLRPPVSGWFENYYVDEMGSPIRSELWACMAPGNPEKAAELAWMDSCLDHAGGEGMWGEIFWAGVQSAAFFLSDTQALIRLGLALIPPSCNISRVIREACYCHTHQIPWAEARDRIYRVFYNDQPCNAIVNTGFTLLGWLYGKDFGDKLCKAVNCGYDTDCTAATLGATLGIIHGAQQLPPAWLVPIGDQIILHRFTTNFDAVAPKTITELTDRIIVQSERFAIIDFTNDATIPPSMEQLFQNQSAPALWTRDVRAAQSQVDDYQVTFHYYGDPVFYPHEPRAIKISVRHQNQPIIPDSIQLSLQKNWQQNQFVITAPEFTGPQIIQVTFTHKGTTHSTNFTILSPSDATGYPAGQMIPRCPVCTGTPGHCLCKK